ncbi:MAG: UDP-N-acetylmuramyl pentapeptide phosphotransferase, partial [Actinobacteria bacterium]|nr:UDP-N-acetylmuramyl pentapeptide phosphotransferase [Actinomycetota bacterium]
MKGILFAGAISLLVSFFATPALIRILARRGYGQIIRDDGPTTHHVKRGTPTMGGIVLIIASAMGYGISHLLTGVSLSTSALLVLGMVIGLGLVGFLDDWLKVSK